MGPVRCAEMKVCTIHSHTPCQCIGDGLPEWKDTLDAIDAAGDGNIP